MVEVEGDVHIPCVRSMCVYSHERMQPSPSLLQSLKPWRKIVWPCCLLLGQSHLWRDHIFVPPQQMQGWRERSDFKG